MRVLLVYPWRATFIERDCELLSHHFEVRTLETVLSRKAMLKTLESLVALLLNIVWAEVVFVWFADHHSLWATRFCRLFGAKSIVVVGGFEVARVPDIEYGSRLSSRRSAVVKAGLERADIVIAVSEFSRREILELCPSARVRLVYNAVDTGVFVPAGGKQDLVVTVATVNKESLRRKGIMEFMECARNVSEAQFAIIGGFAGVSVSDLENDAPPNLRLIGRVPHSELLEYYQRARVYCQFSIYESFGVALVEAMSCMCTPVVSNRGALPEIVGEVGFIVQFGDIPAAVCAVKKALAMNGCEDARKRVEKNFSVHRREVTIRWLIEDLVRRK